MRHSKSIMPVGMSRHLFAASPSLSTMLSFVVWRSLDADHIPAKVEGPHFGGAEVVYHLRLSNYLTEPKIETIFSGSTFRIKTAAVYPLISVIKAADHHAKSQRTEPQRTGPSIIGIPSNVEMSRGVSNLLILVARVLKPN
jgi:hypothetical protein